MSNSVLNAGCVEGQQGPGNRMFVGKHMFAPIIKCCNCQYRLGGRKSNIKTGVPGNGFSGTWAYAAPPVYVSHPTCLKPCESSEKIRWLHKTQSGHLNPQMRSLNARIG